MRQFNLEHRGDPEADPGFILGGDALVSCSTSTPINHIVFFLQNTSCIRKPQGGGGGAHPLHPPPRSAPGIRSSGTNRSHTHRTSRWSLFQLAVDREGLVNHIPILTSEFLVSGFQSTLLLIHFR